MSEIEIQRRAKPEHFTVLHVLEPSRDQAVRRFEELTADLHDGKLRVTPALREIRIGDLTIRVGVRDGGRSVRRNA